MNGDAANDIWDASDVHRKLISAGVTPVSLLGGCWISWMSDQQAKDWDFFISAIHKKTLTQLGYSFERGLSGNKNIDSSGFVVSQRSVFGREQIILTDHDPTMVWCSFDYMHCMLGLEGTRYTEISVGLEAIWQSFIMKNFHGSVKNSRDVKVLDKKLAGMSAWGKSKNELETLWFSVVDLYLNRMGIVRPRRIDVSDLPPSTYTSVSWKDSEPLRPILSNGKKERPETCYICDRPATRGSGGVPVCGSC